MTQPRICQFAGHGGPGDTRHERGYISPDGAFREKDWALSLSVDLDVVLGRWGVASLLGRTADVCIRHNERGVIAANWCANLVIEHHVNAHDDPEIDGIMCFVRQGDSVGLEVAEAIARAAPKQLLRWKSRAYITSPDDWTKDANACLRPHGGTAAVLIEWGFATSTRDLAILTSPTSRPAIVAAFMAGVGRFYEVL